MSGHPEEQVSTADLAKQLSEINTRLDLQQKARHEANSALQKTILKFGQEAVISSDQINNLELMVKRAVDSLAPFGEIKEDAKEIKRVLFGDDKKREKGLVQRFDEVDNVVKKALIEQRAFFIIIGAIAAIITFAKGSGILKWLAGP